MSEPRPTNPALTRKLRHLVMALLCAAAATGLFALPLFEDSHDLDIDLLHTLNAATGLMEPSSEPSHITVVAIDEATHSTEPFAGIPKVMWTPQIAAVQDAILAGGARVIGWDLILPTSAATYVADRNFDAALLKSLSAAREGGRVILGTANLGDKAIEPHRLFSWAAGGTTNLRSLNVLPDRGGVIRKVPAFHMFRKQDGAREFVTSMALEMAARKSEKKVQKLEKGAFLLGGQPVRGAEPEGIIVNFSGPSGQVPTYSFANLHTCTMAGNTEFFKTHFAGKAVLMGLVLDIEDRKLAANRLYTDGGPVGPVHSCGEAAPPKRGDFRRATIPGVYLQAVAINNILRGDGLVRFSPTIRKLLAFPLALAVGLVTLSFSLSSAAILAALFGTAWIALAAILFSQAQLLPLLAPLSAGAATFVVALGLRFIFLDRQGRFLKRAFGSYVAPALVDQLVANPDQLKLGGERREMSFLFSDLAGFTGMVEKQEPEQAVRLLNDYLDNMIEIAKRHGGTVDKVIGDAVVVLFSAPVRQEDHAGRAVRCANEMDEFASRFAHDHQAKGIPFGITRIGVHSGTAIIGNFGGSGFFDYTALGDAMNTAARLESANKQFGTRVSISGATAGRCPGFTGRKIGDIVLKGKKEATPVFEPVAEADAISDAFQRYSAAYELMARRDRDARMAFEDYAADFPDDGLAAFHLTRLRDEQTGETVKLLEK